MSETADPGSFSGMKPGDKKNVLLSVVGENRSPEGGEPETIRVVTVGTLLRECEEWKLCYTESDPEGTASQEVSITVQDRRVIMDRSGDYSTTMVFERGKRFDGAYHTPWGDMAMGIYTIQAGTAFEGAQGLIKLCYQVDIQGQFTAMHDLTLRFAPND